MEQGCLQLQALGLQSVDLLVLFEACCRRYEDDKEESGREIGMKIEFYIPKDEKIPTDLRLKVDGIDVYYERIKGGFRFYVYVDSDEKALEIVKAIAEQMIFDHDESQHGVSWRTLSFEVTRDEWGFRRIVDWRYRVRDSY